VIPIAGPARSCVHSQVLHTNEHQMAIKLCTKLKMGVCLRRFKRREKERKGREKNQELERKQLKRVLEEGLEEKQISEEED